MQRCLFVRPATSADANGGDSVVYRRVEQFIADRAELVVLELQRVPRPAQLLNVIGGLPPEAAGYAGADNQRRVDAAIGQGGFDVALFGHESVFPLALAAPEPRRRVLHAHNVQSLLSADARSPWEKWLRRLAVRFDRRWASGPRDVLVCISRTDVAGLRALGVVRDIGIAPPGAPPAVPLARSAEITPEVVLTGSYGWWRKRRDLFRFAAEPPLPFPILVGDALAAGRLDDQARRVDPRAVDWGAGLRFAVVPDRFVGGFKLKTLEYVALNCMILSYCDVRPEFEGLPHVDEFVRLVQSKAEIGAAIEAALDEPARPQLERFAAFKAACLDRYDWDSCLQPLGEALGL